MALLEKNLPAEAGEVREVGSIPGGKDPLGEEMATHPSIPAWRVPWTEEPGKLQSIGSQRAGLKGLSTAQQYYCNCFLVTLSHV